MSENKQMPRIAAKIIKEATPLEEITKSSVSYAPVIKSDKSEQISETEAYSSSDWVPKLFNQFGLKNLVINSTILPQCVKAYKQNIAGFGIGVRYTNRDEDETEEKKAEFDQMVRVIELLNFDRDTKEIFEDIVEARETYGIAYLETIRDGEDHVCEVDFIKNTRSIEMTRPMGEFLDVPFFYKGEELTRKKQFKQYKQQIGGKTVYFKEFGDPRIMDKRNGQYLKDGETLDICCQANELLEFKIGVEPYGEVRWIGQAMGVDGSRKAEGLNHNYFINGRHTPLLIAIKGGTLSDDSMDKLQSYMNGIKGEAGQHAFLILEAENTDTNTGLTDTQKPDIEIKDMASILQKDELFQEYQDNSRKRVQSSFQLPDLYVAYTTDFNRATAQTAMEVTEEQVFQPERRSLAWQINNKLLNGYGFKHCEAYFMEPNLSNPDDLAKILNVTERAGGLTPNFAKELTYKAYGKDCENYPDDWGETPLAYSKTQVTAAPTPDVMGQLNAQITKAAYNKDDEVVAIMKEVKRLLKAESKGGD